VPTGGGSYAANALVDLYWANRGLYGVRKLWHAARRAGHPWGRDQVGRLMGIAGINGVRRGRRSTVTTHRDQAAPRHPDLVDRAWATPSRPDQWWVADFERHEAPWIRVEVRDLHRRAVAAARLELRAV
jgi:putative transposase